MSRNGWALEVESPTIGALSAVITESGILDSAGYAPVAAPGGRLGYVIAAIAGNSPPEWMVNLCAYLEDERGYPAAISRR